MYLFMRENFSDMSYIGLSLVWSGALASTVYIWMSFFLKFNIADQRS